MTKTEGAAHVDTAVYRDGDTDWLWMAHDDVATGEAVMELWKLCGTLREKVLEMHCDHFSAIVTALGYAGE